jgi:hypothetical protein
MHKFVPVSGPPLGLEDFVSRIGYDWVCGASSVACSAMLGPSQTTVGQPPSPSEPAPRAASGGGRRRGLDVPLRYDAVTSTRSHRP